MADRVKIDINTAAEFAAKGYTVEHYVVLDEPVKSVKGKVNGRRQFTKISPKAKFTLSFDGSPPKQGAMADGWNALKQDLFKDDPTAVYTYKEIVAGWEHYLGTKAGASHLVRRYKVLREVA